MKRMMKALAIAITATLLTLGMPLTASGATSGFYVQGRHLFDANGQRFEMRGINHAAAFFPNETRAFADIRATGANTIRVVVSNGAVFNRTTTAQLQDTVNRCKASRLVCVVEMHDTTGYKDSNSAPAGAASLASAVAYWKSMSSVLKGQEKYVIINIGNEPFGNVGSGKVTEWTSATKNAIRDLRIAGFTHSLMVDAPNWGQDWTNTMRDSARSVFDSDPRRNTIFSVHMYEVYQSGDTIRAYLDSFVNQGLPIVIGELGPEHYGKDVNESAIMTAAENRGIGYLAWSWSGNNSATSALNMVSDFDPNRLTSWGSRVLNYTDGIKNTSKTASVYFY